MGAIVEEEKERKKTEKTAPQARQTVQRDLSDVNGPEGGMLPDTVSAKIQSMRGSGQKLSDKNLEHFSQKFGRDMSDVHVHTDAASDTISRSLNARAFTIGSDVFLTKGINPDGGGRDAQTMTHELTHVVQQGGHASAGPLKLGAADTAQEHEAESTAMREYDPKLDGEDDTIQRGFWSSLGSAIGQGALGMLGISDAFDEFMSGDKKVRAAIKKMSPDKKAVYDGIEDNIKRAEEQHIPGLKDKIKQYQKQMDKSIDMGEKARLEQEIETAQMALTGQEQMLQDDLNQQYLMLKNVDETITKDDINRYRSGGTKTFFSSIFASIGGNILGAFENDPEKKAKARAGGMNSVNSWFASKNKGSTNIEEESEEQQAAKADQLKQRQANLVDSIWNDVQADEALRSFYATKLLYKREISKNQLSMIQESIKEGESDEEIKQSVLSMLRRSAKNAVEEAKDNGGKA